MREILFKAYIKPLKWIVPVVRIDFDCKTVEVDLTAGEGSTAEYSFDEIELLEYTGLTDKNGIRIFEGYVCKLNNNPRDLVYICFGEFGVVDFETESIADKVIGFYYKVIPTDELSKCEPFCFDMQLNVSLIKHLEIEVIGNKWDNPELLEVK